MGGGDAALRRASDLLDRLPLLEFGTECLAKCRELIHHFRTALKDRLRQLFEMRRVPLSQFAERHDHRERIVNPVLNLPELRVKLFEFRAGEHLLPRFSKGGC